MASEFSDLLMALHNLPGVDRVKRRQDEGGLLSRAVVYLDNGKTLSVIRSPFIFAIGQESGGERPFEIAELAPSLNLSDPGEVYGSLSMEEAIDLVTSFTGRQAKDTFAMVSHRVLRKLKI